MRPRIVVRSDLRHEVRLTDQWEEFTSHRETALCEVLMVPDLRTWELWDAFVAHRARHDLTPCVLATTADAENLKQLIIVVLHELVWLDRNGSVDLTDPISCACARGLLRRCSRLFAEAVDLDTWLRDALIRCVLASPAVREVNELAASARKGRGTVSAAWTRFVGPKPAVRLKPVLDLVLLLRATHLRPLGLSDPGIARNLGLGVDVLRDISKARVSKGLSELTGGDGPPIVRLLGSLLEGAPVEWPVKLGDFADDVVADEGTA